MFISGSAGPRIFISGSAGPHSEGPPYVLRGSTEFSGPLRGPHTQNQNNWSAERSSNAKSKRFCALEFSTQLRPRRTPRRTPAMKNSFCVLRPQLRLRTRVHRQRVPFLSTPIIRFDLQLKN